jgi:hypothetical protein
MRGWTILGVTLLVGIGIGAVGSRQLPSLAETYLPDLLVHPPLVEGRVVKKQREADRVLLKVQTEHGPVLATFTKKVAEIDLLVEPGDTLVLRLPAERTFVDDPVMDRVKQSAAATPASPAAPTGHP